MRISQQNYALYHTSVRTDCLFRSKFKGSCPFILKIIHFSCVGSTLQSLNFVLHPASPCICRVKVLCVTLLSTSVFIGVLKQLCFVTFHLKRFLWAEFISYVRVPLTSVMGGELYCVFGQLVESKFRMSAHVASHSSALSHEIFIQFDIIAYISQLLKMSTLFQMPAGYCSVLPSVQTTAT